MMWDSDSFEERDWLALGLTLAERWPLLNALPTAERTRALASLRRRRVRLIGPLVAPEAAPSVNLNLRTTAGPDPGRDPGGAGMLHRKEWRGVSVDPRRRHARDCLWSREVWPLTSKGDIIPCSCGVADGLEGAIAGPVKAHLWAMWREIEANLLRVWWSDATPRQRKRRRHEANTMGTLKTPHGTLTVRRPPVPVPVPVPVPALDYSRERGMLGAIGVIEGLQALIRVRRHETIALAIVQAFRALR